MEEQLYLIFGRVPNTSGKEYLGQQKGTDEKVALENFKVWLDENKSEDHPYWHFASMYDSEILVYEVSDVVMFDGGWRQGGAAEFYAGP